MSKGSNAVKVWRQKTKLRLVNGMGGGCAICGYNKSTWALEFHHIDPTKKVFSLSCSSSTIFSWERIVEEAKKCVLLCSNCHKELHAGVAELPQEIPVFNQDYENYKSIIAEKSTCISCGKERIRCKHDKCLSCRKRKKSPEQYEKYLKIKKNKPTPDELRNLLNLYSIKQISEIYEVTAKTIRAWKNNILGD